MTKQKKALYITLGSLDLAITLFLFVVSIIMIATTNPDQIAEWRKLGHVPANMIEYFQLNPVVYLCVGVIPLFVLLGVNIGVVIHLVKKNYQKKQLQLNDLSDEQKEALRKELLSDLEKKD